MSVRNYHYILRNNPEDGRSQSHCAVTCTDDTNVYLISVYTILMGGTKPVSVVIMTTEVGIRLLESKEIFCSLLLTCSPPDQGISKAASQEVTRSATESDDTLTSSVEIQNCESVRPFLLTSSGQSIQNILEKQFHRELRR